VKVEVAMNFDNDFMKEINKIVAIYNMRMTRISIEKNKIHTDISALKKKYFNLQRDSFP